MSTNGNLFGIAGNVVD